MDGAPTLPLDALAHARRLRGQSETTIRLDLVILRSLGKPPADCTQTDLEAAVLRSRSPSTRATYSRRLRSSFALMREVGAIPADCTPDVGLAKIREPQGRPRPFTPEQVERLRLESRQPWRDAIWLASLTGMRAMELWALTGADLVDGMHGPEIEVVGKGGKAATIPAHPAVVAIIEGHRTLGRIFPQWSTPAVLSTSVSREIRRVLGAGTLHQLRHSFATQVLAATGGDILTVQTLLRHESIQTTLTYAQLASHKPADAVRLLAG